MHLRGRMVLERWNEQLKNYPRVAAALLFLIAFAPYGRSLANGFVYDDVPQILENPFVQNSHLWSRIFTGSVWSFQGAGMYQQFYRPLQFFSYWLLCRLAGLNPSAFHLFQLVLYAVTVVLVYRLGRALLENELAAFLGALLWALHPLHVEAVAWVGALADAGFGFFYLLAFLLFVRAEKRAERRLSNHILAAVVYFPSLFFKEMAFSLPLLLLAYWLSAARRDSWRHRAARWLPYLVAVAACAAIRVKVMGQLTSASHPWRVPLRVMGAGLGLLGGHTRLFFWPIHLEVYRTFELGPSLRSPWPWLTLAGLFTAFWIRKREPELSFLIIWWGVTLLPSLDVRQLSTPLLADRFSYLPSVGLCLAISSLVFVRLAPKVPKMLVPAFLVPGLAALMIFWTIKTVSAVPQWHDNFSLLTSALQQSPDSPSVHMIHASDLLYRTRDFEASAREYETALRLNSTGFLRNGGIDSECFLGLGQIAYQQGKTEEAIRFFEKAVQTSPNRSLAYNYLGTIYFPRGDYAKAASYFEQAVRVNPYDLIGRLYLGTCWMKVGKYHEAAEQFRTTHLVDPSYWQAYEAEARALQAEGDSARAAQVRALLQKRRGY